MTRFPLRIIDDECGPEMAACGAPDLFRRYSRREQTGPLVEVLARVAGACR